MIVLVGGTGLQVMGSREETYHTVLLRTTRRRDIIVPMFDLTDKNRFDCGGWVVITNVQLSGHRSNALSRSAESVYLIRYSPRYALTG